jgi:Cd2+/Zn2+-exporting ATPase
VKGGVFLELAAKVDAVAFDKTGTLTRGRPEVDEVVTFGGRDTSTVLGIAASLEAHSNHPAAQAVVRAAGTVPNARALEEYRETPGVGVSARIGSTRWELCSPACAEERAALDDAVMRAIEHAEAQGASPLVLIETDAVAGLICVADEVRAEAPEAVAGLRRLGMEHLVMLTGDSGQVADAVTRRTGLTSYLARLLPEAKTDAVRALKERFDVVAMVGDGVNDAPALATSDIGIAMGAAGTDTALETADVALLRDDLSALPGFFALGRRTRRTIIANVTFSIVVKAVFLVLALTGQATLWMAVFADTGVSLLVILNGMRLLRPA